MFWIIWWRYAAEEEMANDWLRGVVTPVVVAVIVGLVSGYMASQNALAVHGEKISTVTHRVDRFEARIDELSKTELSIARMEVQMSQVAIELQRINAKLDAPTAAGALK
jgi:hypothetical protein